jgi:signal transduction histidine kinase
MKLVRADFEHLSQDRLRALVEAGIELNSELSLERVLERVVESAATLTGARRALLKLAAEGGGEVGRLVSFGIDSLSREAADQILAGPGTLSEPILIRGKPFAHLYLAAKRNAQLFTAEDEELLRALTTQAAVAIEMSERVARDSLRRVVAAQELERRRLARELHDETGQALTSVLLGLQTIIEAPDAERAVAEAEHLRELVKQALQDVRRLAVELRPKALDDFGLLPALKRLGSGFSEQTGIRVEVESFLGEERLPSEIETALYRIVQESLTNVVKHARAGSVSVLVTRKSGSVIAVIEDDGRGFDAGARRDEGLGLVGMEERMALLDGRLQIESSEGAGTTIVAEVPLR